MSTTAWSALADRFLALAGEQEFCFHTDPANSTQLFPNDVGRFQLVYPFRCPSGVIGHYDIVAGAGATASEEFARMNRFRWLAWAAGLLLRPGPYLPAELHWWRHVLCEGGRQPVENGQRSTLAGLSSASEFVARQFAGGATLPPPFVNCDQTDNWPSMRDQFRTLWERFNDRRWHTSRPNCVLLATPDPNGFGVWRRRDFDRAADLRIGENRSWSCRGSVWGYTEEVEAFVGLAEDAGTALPIDLTFTPALFPSASPFANLRQCGVESWLEFLFLLNPSAFTLEHDWPCRGSRIARLTANPFALSATTLARLLDTGPSAVVADFHAGAVLLNPWLDGDDREAVVTAVAAAGNCVTSSAPLPPAPHSQHWSFGDLVTYVGAIERAVADTRAEATALGGAPGAGYKMQTAARIEADALHKKHPAVPALEGYVNYHHGEFTHANLVRVRGELCRARGCGTDEVNVIPLEHVPGLLGWPAATPGRSEVGVRSGSERAGLAVPLLTQFQAVRTTGGVMNKPVTPNPPDQFRQLECVPSAGKPSQGESPTPKPADTDATGLKARPEGMAKKSTTRGDGLAKLVAALTKHHGYADGGCLNLEPVGNNQLASAAGVSNSTASAFFGKKFEGHTEYTALCRDSGALVGALKLLNGDIAPHHLYGRQPPGEGATPDE